MDAPILFFAFRRPKHTRIVLESLAKNSEATSCHLFAFIDGARNQEEERLADEVEAVIRSKSWCERCTVVRRGINLGCARSVIETVTEYIDSYGAVIVVEDDNLLSPFFLNYIFSGLNRYRDDPRVMEITGYRYPVTTRQPRTGFINHGVGWGWATWKRAWNLFEEDGQRLLRSMNGNRVLASSFDMGGASPFLDLLRAHTNGQIGGWDIRWSASIALNHGFTLFPAQSLAANIGHDGTGTNCGPTSQYDVLLSHSKICDFPERIELDIDYYRSTKNFFINNQPGRYRRIMHKTKNLFSYLV